MFSAKIIQSGLEDLKRITKADFFLCGKDRAPVASTFEKMDIDEGVIDAFAKGNADGQNIKGYNFLKIAKDNDESYVLITFANGADGYMISRIAASEVSHLMAIDTVKVSKDEFYKDLLYDNILLGEIKMQSEKLHINPGICRRIMNINVPEDIKETSVEIIRNMYSDSKNDYVLSLSGNTIILIKSFEESCEEEAVECASQIVSTMNTELLTKARVAYGRAVYELKDLSESYREATMAMEVMMIFYDEREVTSYRTLGIGRLIHQLPKELCEMFLEEVFENGEGYKLSDENIHIIEVMFANNLNVAETARMIGVKRTTLIYKLDKIKKLLGLDVCSFEDAITLKVAMMVAKYTSFNKRNVQY